MVDIVVRRGQQELKRTLHFEEINTPEKFAAWLVNQRFPDEADEPTLHQRRFTIGAHQETVIDPETGEEATVWVVDSVGSIPIE